MCASSQLSSRSEYSTGLPVGTASSSEKTSSPSGCHVVVCSLSTVVTCSASPMYSPLRRTKSLSPTFITCTTAERRPPSFIRVLAVNIPVPRDRGSTAQSPDVWRSDDKAGHGYGHVDCVTSWIDRVLDGVDPSQHALTRSTDQSHNLSIDFDEILIERPPAAVAAQPVGRCPESSHPPPRRPPRQRSLCIPPSSE